MAAQSTGKKLSEKILLIFPENFQEPLFQVFKSVTGSFVKDFSMFQKPSSKEYSKFIGNILTRR